MMTTAYQGTRHNVRTADDFRSAKIGCLYCPLQLTGIAGVTVCETATGRAICTTCCGCPEPGTAADYAEIKRRYADYEAALEDLQRAYAAQDVWMAGYELDGCTLDDANASENADTLGAFARAVVATGIAKNALRHAEEIAFPNEAAPVVTPGLF
tara:strand:- start:685 stop:1149 length:465 start_codon:yes stop_codon:yes gene_type:complete